MKEVLVILGVIVVLLMLTAIRYRKQISGLIALARVMKEAKDAVKNSHQITTEKAAGGTLVNCSKCDIWVPQNKAVRFRNGYICSSICQQAAAGARTDR